MWPILKIDARTQTEAAPDEQTEMRIKPAHQSLITDVPRPRLLPCTIRSNRSTPVVNTRRRPRALGVLDLGHQNLRPYACRIG